MANMEEAVARLRWCAPGDDQQDRWLLRFNDNDMRDLLFDNEAEARDAWERYCGLSGNWNGYLFSLAPRASLPPDRIEERCPTCDAEKPTDNEFCSDGFHAPNGTYWPDRIEEPTEAMLDVIAQVRRDEIQAMGAAISLRNWQLLERAYNVTRDKIDAALTAMSREGTASSNGSLNATQSDQSETE